MSDSSYHETPIAGYQALCDPSRPLRRLSWGEQDAELVKICAQIKNATWSLTLELDHPADPELKGNMLAITGRVGFRAKTVGEVSSEDANAQLVQMSLQIIPFVYSVQSGWWAQAPVRLDNVKRTA